MTRTTVIALVMVCAGLAGVAAISTFFAQRDLERLERDFESERLDQVERLASEVAADLRGINDDLRFAAELVRSTKPNQTPRPLAALLAVVEPYRAINVYDAEGQRLLSVTDPGGEQPQLDRARVEEMMASTADRALASTRFEVVTSPPLPGDPWYRIFARKLPKPGPNAAVSLLVDTSEYFGHLELMTAGGFSKLLLLGPHGRPAASSDPGLANEVEHLDPARGRIPIFTELIDQMRKGARGTERLPAGEATDMALGTAPVIASFAPIPMTGAGTWSIAAFTSVAEMRSEERGSVNRLLLTSGAMGLLIIGFGVQVLLSSRRAVAARERLRHAERFAHLHEKTEKILDQIPTGVLALSEEGRITSANRMLRQRLGSVESLRLEEAFAQAPHAVVEGLEALVASAIEDDAVRSIPGGELALFGQPGHYSVHAVPLVQRFPDARVLVVVDDLNEVQSLAARLLRAEKLATVGVIAAGIAHEIGTPLSVVRARAEFLQGKLGPEHPQSGSVRVMLDQIDLVTRTIRQLLDFSRTRAIASRAVDLGPVARSVAELLRFQLQRRKVELAVAVPEKLPALGADPDQLQQVLVNLVMNACDACGPGGNVRIEAREAAADEAVSPRMVRIDVLDDGCGIPEEYRNQVFDPFFTTKKRGQGTGLGLTMVAQIVRNHGGQVEIESAPGRGTRARVWWPSATPSEEQTHAAAV